jgi:regulator of protease activity HflC (stomatin/prohibitin superfamily)
MLISGGKQKTEGATFQVVIGHGKWIMPGFRKVRFLGLELHKVNIEESCRCNEGILLNLIAVAAFKVQSDVNSVNAAAQRFLGEQKKGQMEEMTHDIFAGHLRSIVGSMSIDDIHKNRDALAVAIMEHSQTEMSRLGLTVDSLQIEHFDDGNSGYLDNRAAPHLAGAARDAAKAKASAEQESAQAEQEAQRKKNDQIRETQLKQAAIKAEVDKAQAEAAAAGQLAQADVERQVLERRQAVADTNAVLTERQLIAEKIKPAEAEARRVRIEADAQASAAEAAAHQLEVNSTAAAARDVRMAEANAQVVKAQAAANAEQVKLNANANAEAERVQGEARAAASKAEGLAKAEALKAAGLAEAAGNLAKAEALAANDRAQIAVERIKAMPEVARAIAEGLGLNNATVTVLDGPEGLTKFAAAVLPLAETVMGLFAKEEPATTGRGNGDGDRTPISAAEAQLAAARNDGR